VGLFFFEQLVGRGVIASILRVFPPATNAHFFTQVHHAVQRHDELCTLSYQCLSQLASVHGEVFASEGARALYYVHYTSLLLKLLVEYVCMHVYVAAAWHSIRISLGGGGRCCISCARLFMYLWISYPGSVVVYAPVDLVSKLSGSFCACGFGIQAQWFFLRLWISQQCCGLDTCGLSSKARPSTGGIR
jgi:hypothetical protein